MKVHPSALKHGVEEHDAVHAAEWPLWVEPLDDEGPPQRELRLGFDTAARLLETVLLILEDGAESVIHACGAASSTSTCFPERARSAADPSLGDDQAAPGLV